MTTGLDWIVNFQKTDTETLESYRKAILKLCEDEMFKKIFGYEEGLLTMEILMADIVERRSGKNWWTTPICYECKCHMHLVKEDGKPNYWQCDTCNLIVDLDKI